MSRPSLDDYVDVAERIQQFKEAYPGGSLQTVGWEVVEVAGKTFIVYRAAAYRDTDDRRPGQGIAWEPFPGKTPYTKDSELMNAETAAWGRAIVALGFAANGKIASRQEVRARTEEPETAAHEPTEAPPGQVTSETLAELRKQYGRVKPSDGDWLRLLAEVGITVDGDDVAAAVAGATEDQATALVLALVRESR